MAHQQPAEAATQRWFVLGRLLVSSLHLWILLWLLAAVVVPTVVFGWQPMVISSGSMEPLIRRGDVILAEEEPPDSIAPGHVITYVDPRGGGSLVSHRVVSIESLGFRTQGDANRVADSVAVPATSVLGRGRLLVPLIGLPLVWLTENPLLLALWIVATVASGCVLVGSRSPASHAPGRWSRAGRSVWAMPAAVAAGLVVTVALVLVASTFVDRSAAAFTANTAGTDNSFVAGTFCSGSGSATVITSGDTTVAENKSSANTSAAAQLYVRSAVQSNARALLQFPLPTIPGGCTVTAATLTLNAVGEEAGRSYEVVRAGSAFDVSTVTWDSQPPPSGTAAVTVTDGVAGATDFDATAPVIDLYGVANHGLILRDRDERASPALPAGNLGPGRSESTYDSEQAPPGEPRLTVFWGP